MSDDEPLPVEFDELLAAEFDYIAQTAAQATEDRARVSSFYLIAVGSLIAAMFGTQFLDMKSLPMTVNLMFSGLFLLLTLLGTSTIMQLARLRSAWYESMLAMNQLKDYMIKENKPLSEAFRWQSSTLPPKYRTGSVSYYQAMEVALISALMLGAAMFFLLQAFFSIGLWHWIISALMGILTIFLQLRLYKQILK
jgi:F0F1-type ATP synthase assembly protein I